MPLYASPSSGTFTPTFTFATPGNLSMSYTTQVGTYYLIGKQCFINVNLNFTPTHTTASGNATIGGVPFTSANLDSNDFAYGAGQWNNITKANYTNLAARFAPNASTILISAWGSGQASALVTASDIPSAGNTTIRFSLNYRIA